MAEQVAEKKGFKMPSSYTVLFIIIAIMALLGLFQLDNMIKQKMVT